MELPPPHPLLLDLTAMLSKILRKHNYTDEQGAAGAITCRTHMIISLLVCCSFALQPPIVGASDQSCDRVGESWIKAKNHLIHHEGFFFLSFLNISSYGRPNPQKNILTWYIYVWPSSQPKSQQIYHEFHSFTYVFKYNNHLSWTYGQNWEKVNKNSFKKLQCRFIFSIF